MLTTTKILKAIASFCINNKWKKDPWYKIQQQNQPVSVECLGEHGTRSNRNHLWLDIISGLQKKNTLANKSIVRVRAASALIWCEMPHLFCQVFDHKYPEKASGDHCIVLTLRDCQGETLDLIFRAHSQLHYSAQAPVLPHYHPSGNTCFDSFTLAKKETASERERQKKR